MKYSFNLKKSDKKVKKRKKIITNLLSVISFMVVILSLYICSLKIYKVISLNIIVKKSVGELKIPDKREINRFNRKIDEINNLYKKIDFSFSQLFTDLEKYLIKGILIKRIELSLHKFKRGPILPGGKMTGYCSNMKKVVELTHRLSKSKKFYDVLLTNVKNENGKTSFEMVFHYEK